MLGLLKFCLLVLDDCLKLGYFGFDIHRSTPFERLFLPGSGKRTISH